MDSEIIEIVEDNTDAENQISLQFNEAKNREQQMESRTVKDEQITLVL